MDSMTSLREKNLGRLNAIKENLPDNIKIAYSAISPHYVHLRLAKRLSAPNFLKEYIEEFLVLPSYGHINIYPHETEKEVRDKINKILKELMSSSFSIPDTHNSFLIPKDSEYKIIYKNGSTLEFSTFSSSSCVYIQDKNRE